MWISVSTHHEPIRPRLKQNVSGGLSNASSLCRLQLLPSYRLSRDLYSILFYVGLWPMTSLELIMRPKNNLRRARTRCVTWALSRLHLTRPCPHPSWGSMSCSMTARLVTTANKILFIHSEALTAWFRTPSVFYHYDNPFINLQEWLRASHDTHW